MASQWSFRHLQPKLWAKEGSGIGLFPTCAPGVRHGVEKLSSRATTLVQTSSRSEVGVRSYGCPKSRDSNPGQFRDSTLGVPGQKAIRMPPPRSNTEYTIGSKVVAYSRVRAVVSLVCPSARGKSQHPRVSRMLN
jgi:hypothetical protein